MILSCYRLTSNIYTILYHIKDFELENQIASVKILENCYRCKLTQMSFYFQKLDVSALLENALNVTKFAENCGFGHIY